MIYNENCEHCRQKRQRGLGSTYSPIQQRRRNRRQTYGSDSMSMSQPGRSSFSSRHEMPSMSLSNLEPRRYSSGPERLSNFSATTYHHDSQASVFAEFDRLWRSIGMDSPGLNESHAPRVPSAPVNNAPHLALDANIAMYTLGINQSRSSSMDQGWPTAPPSSPEFLPPNLSTPQAIPTLAPSTLYMTLPSPEDFMDTLNLSSDFVFPERLPGSAEEEQEMHGFAVQPTNRSTTTDNQLHQMPHYPLEALEDETMFIL